MLDEHDEEKRRKNHYDKDPLLTLELLEELKTLILVQIETAVADYSLLYEKYFSLILDHWKKFGALDKIDLFIKNVLSDDIRTIKFIKAFSSYSRAAGEGEVIAKNVLRIRLDRMKDFVEIEKVNEKVCLISSLPKNIDEELKKCFEQFIKEFEAYSEGRSLREW